MVRTHEQRTERLNQLEQAVDALSLLQPDGVARTIPVLVEAMLFEQRAYKTRLRALRCWIETHPQAGDDLDREVTKMLHGARRLEAILKAYQQLRADPEDRPMACEEASVPSVRRQVAEGHGGAEASSP
jgi:hypothetical protein